MRNLVVDDLNVLSEETLVNPNQLKDSIPASENALATVARGRATIKDILERAATLTKLSQSELIRNACLGQYVPMLQTASVPKRG